MSQVVSPCVALLLLAITLGGAALWGEEGDVPPAPAVEMRKPTFFTQHQEADGHWSVSGFAAHCTSTPGCGAGAVSDAADVAVTGEILLAYEHSGYDHVAPSRHRSMLKKAVVWLVARQKADGSFADTLEADCWASAGLGEAYSLSGDAELKAPVTRALASLLERRVRDPEGHPCGWGDQDSGWIDSRLTSWAILALRAGLAGGVVDAVELRRSLTWINAANSQVKAPGNFPIRYNIRSHQGDVGGGAPFAALALAASGMAKDPIHDALLDAATSPDPNLVTDLSGLFATTEALFFAKAHDPMRWGDAHVHWKALKDRLEREQIHNDSCADGTWDPATWPETRGRLESTTLALLVLDTCTDQRSPVISVSP